MLMKRSMQPRTTIAQRSMKRPSCRKNVSLEKNDLFSSIGFGEEVITPAVTIAKMKRAEPTKVAIPSSIPSKSPPCIALREVKTSGAPAPKANSVTPVKLSEKFNLSAIFSSEGLRNSSAVKLSKQKPMQRKIHYKKGEQNVLAHIFMTIITNFTYSYWKEYEI